MKLARLLAARLLLWLVRTFPDVAELGRLALRASRAFASIAERLLAEELRRA